MISLHALLLLSLLERIIRISCAKGEESPRFSPNLMHLLGWDLSLGILFHGRGSSSRKCWHPRCVSQSFDTKTLALHLLLPQSYSLDIVLGSKTSRESFALILEYPRWAYLNSSNSQGSCSQHRQWQYRLCNQWTPEFNIGQFCSAAIRHVPQGNLSHKLSNLYWLQIATDSSETHQDPDS